MAEAVSKSSMFSQCLHHHRISVSPSRGGQRGLPSLNMKPLLLRSSTSSSSSSSQFYGQSLVAVSRRGISRRRNLQSFCAQMSLCIGKAQRWWEKGMKPNMKEITSAQDLVHSLLNAGDKLVVVDFFSPGCGGCKALHPKICQLAEMNPEVQFLQVNYEEHKSMCYSLNVHVLPFFRFYRGTQGRLCSFSCTNATIKKFKDALAKHTPDRCSLGPPKGLEEKELLALSANKDLSFNYAPKPVEAMPVPAEEKILAETSATYQSRSKPPPPPPLPLRLPLTAASTSSRESEEKTLANAGR